MIILWIIAGVQIVLTIYYFIGPYEFTYIRSGQPGFPYGWYWRLQVSLGIVLLFFALIHFRAITAWFKEPEHEERL